MSGLAVRDLVKQDPAMRESLEELYRYKYKWCMTVFPERFYRPFSPGHVELLDILDNKHVQKIVAICHRNFGKTSIIQMAAPSHGICFQDYKFIMPVSASATSATLQSENLKSKLTANKRIRELFGPMKSDVFAKDMWITSTGTIVFPRGAGQQIRSNLFEDYRPDLIPVDDLEDKEGVQSEGQRDKLKRWFWSDLYGCVDHGASNWRIIVMGTLLHEASLLAQLAKDPDWYPVNFPLCDDQFNSYWPDYMTTEQVQRLAESYRRNGMMDEFYREFMNRCTGLETQSFNSKLFRYYDEGVEDLGRVVNTENMILVDPAKTANPAADDTAIVGVAIQVFRHRLYVRDLEHGHYTQDVTYDKIFEMCARLGARKVGVEVDTLHDWIIYPLKNEISRRGLDLEVVELRTKGKSKPDRIKGLIPLYRRGLVYHNKSVCAPLESQLVDFPHSERDDLMDALAYVVPMLALDETTMLPTSSEYDSTEGQSVEDEYKDLDYEEALNMGQYSRI